MPGPKPLPIVGNLWRFLPVIGNWSGKDFLELQWDLHKEYGKIVNMGKINEGQHFIAVFDPVDIEKVYRNEGPTPTRNGFESLNYYRRNMNKEKFEGAHGLLPTNGKEWQDFRRRVQPHMLMPRAVAKYTAPTDLVAGEFVQRLREIRDSNSTLPENTIEWFFRWAFESIALIALDARMGCLARSHAPHSQQQRLIDAVHVLMDCFYALDVEPSAWRYVATPAWRRFVAAVDTFEEIAEQYIQQTVQRLRARVARGQALGDDLSVLERLLLANDNPRVATTMATDMIFAGIETTSYSTSMLLYFLASNPDKQEKLYEELRRVLPARDSSVTSDNLPEMKYLRACIKETLRMRPTVTGQIRENTMDNLVLGNYLIPKGAQLILMTGVSSRLEECVPQAGRFLPERWLKGAGEGEGEGAAARGHPFASLPFGFGARMCIGKRFAELEMEVLGARIIRNFHVEYPREATFATRFVHKITSPLTFKLTDRED